MTALELLGELAWKSALIAAGVLGVSIAMRRYAPRHRAALLRTAIAGLLALPILTVLLPSMEIALLAPTDPPTPASMPMGAATAVLPSWDIGTVASIIYAIGCVGLLGHFAVGLVLLGGMTRRAQSVTAADWLIPFARLKRAHGIRSVDLRWSDEIGSPLSWGWLRPSVVIDRRSLDCPEMAEGVLAHELAHIARRDWPVLVAARIALAVFWFNPLVWRLIRQSAEFAEQAADASAVREVDRLAYARTLTACARAPRAMRPATAIAASPDALAQRVRLLVDDHIPPMRQGMTVPALAVLACAGTGVLLASTQLTSRPAISGQFSTATEIQDDVANARGGASRTTTESVSNAPRRSTTAYPAANRVSPQRRADQSPAAIGASAERRDRQGRAALATRSGAIETANGDRLTEKGDRMTRLGIFETKRGEVMTRLGDLETKRGEEQNRRVAARLRNENGPASPGGPAP